MFEMDPANSNTNFQTMAPSSPRELTRDNMVIKTTYLMPAQYSYNDFGEVLAWVAHFSNICGSHTARMFDQHLKLREYYELKGISAGVKSVENLIKNDVGIHRFDEETENFRQKFSGKGANFWEGKFIGWEGEVEYNPKLKGVVCYEI